MSPDTERLSLTAAVLVATLAWPCLKETAIALEGRVALTAGAERIALVPAAWLQLPPPGFAAGRPRAHRTAAMPRVGAAPQRGNRET
jgi:hypothetical protein